MAEVIVTHAADGAQRARLVAEKLSGLGYVVRQDLEADGALGPHGRRKLAAAIDKAGCVIVLWSKEAAAAPALIETANRAKAKGKLAFARIDAAAAPIGLRPSAVVDLSGWMGRETRPWKALTAAVSAVAKPAVQTARRGAAAAKPAKAAKSAPKAQPQAGKHKGGGALAWFAALLVVCALGAGGYYFFELSGMQLPLH